MIDLSLIQNEKLRDLVANSTKFAALSQEQQRAHLDNMRDADEATVEKLCSFFAEENSKEITKDEQILALKRLVEQLKELELRFHKIMAKEPERKSREAESGKMDSILDELNQS